MKKIFLLVVSLLITITLSAQSTFKRGIIVGPSGKATLVQIDSIGTVSTDMAFYTGSDTNNVYIPYTNRQNFDDILSDLGVFNVKDYGAVGDSTTSNAVAFQAALDAVPRTGGIVYVPAGDYLIESTLRVKHSTRIIGTGGIQYITSGDFEYGAGSILISTGSAKALLRIEEDRGGATEHGGSIVENISFWDQPEHNDSLLVIRMTSFCKISNCNFNHGAVGVKVDAGTEDASWAVIEKSLFKENKVGIDLTYTDAGASALPKIFIDNNVINTVGAGYIGIKNIGGIMGIVSNIEMDIYGKGSIGIDWQKGIHSSITNCKFELASTVDSTTKAIRSKQSGLIMTGISVQGNDEKGTGIFIDKGVSLANPNSGNIISDFSMTGLDYGIRVNDTTSAVKISNGYMLGNFTKYAICFDDNSGNNQVSSIQVGAEHAFTDVGGIRDYSDNSTFIDILSIDGGYRRYYNRYPQEADALTDGAPTQAQITSVLGLTPEEAKAGYVGFIRDNNGTSLLYIVMSDGDNWFYFTSVKGL